MLSYLKVIYSVPAVYMIRINQLVYKSNISETSPLLIGPLSGNTIPKSTGRWKSGSTTWEKSFGAWE